MAAPAPKITGTLPLAPAGSVIEIRIAGGPIGPPRPAAPGANSTGVLGEHQA
jgi:hypothetical protein